MSRLRELVDELCPDGVEYKPMSVAAVVMRTPKGVLRSHYGDGSRIPIIDQGHSLVVGYTDDDNLLLDYGDGCTVFGDHTREVKWVPFPFAVGADGVKVLRAAEGIEQKYLFYALSNLNIRSRGYNRHWSVVRDMSIPVPPIEVQCEIVRILDSFQELDDALTAEIKAREKQLQTLLRRIDINETNESQSKPFKDCCVIGRGTYITKKDVVEGDVPVVMGGLEPAYYHSVSNHTGEALVISRSGVNAGFSSFWNQPIFVSDGFVADSNGNDILKYVYYALHARQRNVDMLRRGSGVPHVNGKMLGELPLYMPSVEEQKLWVRRFEAIDGLAVSLRAERDARRKQFEYYRDRLLTFPEKVA